MPPSRRQPPRSSTPPARRPKVAGLRKPPNADAAPAPVEPAESSSAASSSASPAPAKPRPRPVPRPGPLTSAAPSAAETTQEIRLPGGISRAKAPAEPVDEPLVEAEPEEASPAEVDALTGEEVEEDTADADAPARPRRKRRDEGTAKPDDLDEAEVSGNAYSRVSEPRADRRIGQTLTIGLVIVGLVLAGLAVFFKLQYDTAEGATSNTALLDVAKTAQVKDQVSQATEALFSYDFNNIKKTEDAASNLLANDDVKAKYNSLMGEVKRLAPQQKMVVTCKVTRSAVIMLDGDRARVMVFVDQTSTRADTKQTTAGSAQLHVDAQLQGTTWKITDLDTYEAPAAPSASAPSGQSPASAVPPSK